MSRDYLIVSVKCNRKLLKNYKKIENYGASNGFPVYGGKL